MADVVVSSEVGSLASKELDTRWRAARTNPPAVPVRGRLSSFRFSLPGSDGAVMLGEPAPVAKKRKITPPSTPVTREAWLERLVVTADQVDVISKYEQGSPAWLASRVGRLTASNFGAATGMNKYSSPRSLLKQMLWGEFKGNAATRWGSAHENTARDEYVAVKRGEVGVGADPLTGVEVEEVGLMINTERCWMGNSPDGIVVLTRESGAVERGLLEIKCPYKKEFYTPDPVPPHYYAQIQGTMGNLSLPWCEFVVWTPTGLQVTHVPFDSTFWNAKLLPALTTFYFDTYVPLAVSKENGILEEGCVESVIEIDV
jgi:putative phage-type endonuclease